MFGKKKFVIMITILLLCNNAVFAKHLLFTGDIMLSRCVAKEIEITGKSPWQNIQDLFPDDSVVVGNFEGAVGAMNNCVGKPADLCFAVPEDNLQYLQQNHFRYLSLENNHARDLGKSAMRRTRAALNKFAISALTFNDSPTFFRVNNTTIGIVSYTEIPKQNAVTIASRQIQLAEKIKLAKRHANVVIVYVHWGIELDVPTALQRKQAAWLIEQGADMIIGHHPHVIQKAECILGKPVLFSLGNHIFDQRYPITKTGSVIDCVPSKKEFRCKAYITKTPPNSSFPTSYSEDRTNYKALSVCPLMLHKL